MPGPRGWMSGKHARKSKALPPQAASLPFFRPHEMKKGERLEERRKEGRERGREKGRG